MDVYIDVEGKTQEKWHVRKVLVVAVVVAGGWRNNVRSSDKERECERESDRERQRERVSTWTYFQS